MPTAVDCLVNLKGNTESEIKWQLPSRIVNADFAIYFYDEMVFFCIFKWSQNGNFSYRHLDSIYRKKSVQNL